ncbi:MAG: antibiotic biosynthesis monooxygenase [Armatimonadota bacterium]
MYVTLVYVHVKPQYVQDFALASLENARESRKEPGNLRFDVLQSTEDPSRFILYEAYETPEAAAAHKHTPHYLKWKEIVADWMAEPRQGVSYTGL